MSGYETMSGDNNMKPLISVCSSANVINVQGFIDELSVKFPNFNFQYFELPYNDIDHFTFKGKDVGIMILCHSINNRRFAITDVMDALYDLFLPNSAKRLGKMRICVVAHDFPATKGLDDPDKYKEEMGTFENRQPTAFKTSSLVMMAGKLEGPVELQETNWQQLEEFLERAARSPMPEPRVCPGCCDPIIEGQHRNLLRVVAGLIFIVMLVLIIGLSVGLGSSSNTPVSTPAAVASTPTATPPKQQLLNTQPTKEKRDTRPKRTTFNRQSNLNMLKRKKARNVAFKGVRQE